MPPAKRQQKEQKEPEGQRLQTVSTFLKDSAALITAITALVGALVGLLLLFKDRNITLFAEPTPESACLNYKRGFIPTVVLSNQGLQELYFIQSEETLIQPRLLVFEDASGEVVGMTIFTFDVSETKFVLRSIVDRNCYEVPQGDDNVIQPIPFSNGETGSVRLSDKKTYLLRLVYEPDSIWAEFTDKP